MHDSEPPASIFCADARGKRERLAGAEAHAQARNRLQARFRTA